TSGHPPEALVTGTVVAQGSDRDGPRAWTVAPHTWRTAELVILCAALLSYPAARRLRGLIASGVQATSGRDARGERRLKLSKEGRDEWSTGSRGDAEGRVRPDGGRQAPALGRQRAPLRRLGNLPPQGLAR